MTLSQPLPLPVVSSVLSSVIRYWLSVIRHEALSFVVCLLSSVLFVIRYLLGQNQDHLPSCMSRLAQFMGLSCFFQAKGKDLGEMSLKASLLYHPGQLS